MSKTVSVFYNIDRTYVTLVEMKDDGLELLYLNATDNRIDLENIESDESMLGVQELSSILYEIGDDINRVSITLPADNVFVSKVPGDDDLSVQDIKKLVNFEIRQNFPQFTFEDFSTTVVPLAPMLNGKKMLLCVIVPNDILSTATQLLKDLNLPFVNSIDISQINAHNAFRYNYPELWDKNVVLASIQNKFIDISLSKNGVPGYYNLASFSSNEQISEIIEKELQKILTEAAETIDAVFFFGANLTKDNFMMCWETAMILGLEAKRLNPFRMMRTQLGERERQYCSRTFQIYPPCVGGALPVYHQRVKLF
jgi:Tfp pilus assembly PilM family ATPase